MENMFTVIQKILKGDTFLGGFVLPLQFCHQDLDTIQCTKLMNPHSQVIIRAYILKVPVAFGMSWRLPVSAR